MTTATFFWHDYETFGTDPQRDRPCQFAGIRTDEDFNIVADPLMLYCKMADDYLPHPEACLITGITPQMANEKGVCEAEFARIINEQLAQPGTCGVGYNSIRFDDEVTRNLLYRNFFDPYAREWQNGNSRWDLIDIVRAARALRPEGIEWPVNEEGVATFRLEVLTQANGIAHQAAHDALSDVHATIALARLVKQRQPKLYDYLYSHRHKSAALQLLKVGSYTPLVHISGRFAARNHCLAIVLPLCMHPRNSNEVIVYDLSAEPTPLLELGAADIQQRVFTATDALPEGSSRIPLKTVHINKSPVLAPLSVITAKDAERLQLDLGLCQTHARQIESNPQLNQKLAEVFTRDYTDIITDPDLMIYSGGFFGQKDKTTFVKIRQAAAHQLAEFDSAFEDARLPEMLFRYRARNYPETLSTEERLKWRNFIASRLNDASSGLNLDSFDQKIEALRQQLDLNQPLLQQLAAFAKEKRLYSA